MKKKIKARLVPKKERASKPIGKVKKAPNRKIYPKGIKKGYYT